MKRDLLICTDIEEALGILRVEGFRLDYILPADSPETALVSKGEVLLRLQKAQEGKTARPLEDYLDTLVPDASDDEFDVIAHTRAAKAQQSRHSPCIEFSTSDDSHVLNQGRAGMVYRDLVPSRLGGFVAASRITIRDGGPVPDYVHHHLVDFQLILCLKGWVKVVYENQGDPFILNKWDLVLQPPGLRHRVLESSPSLEVLEISSPAVHPTYADHALALPNTGFETSRDLAPQSFLRLRYEDVSLEEDCAGLRSFETPVISASGGAGRARFLFSEAGGSYELINDGTFLILYALQGSVALGETVVSSGGYVSVPPDVPFDISFSENTIVFEVRLK